MLDSVASYFQSRRCSFLAGSCQSISMESEVDESLMSEEVLRASDYAEDIHQHLRVTEVRDDPYYGHPVIT